MFSPSINQTTQYLGWFLALVEFILGLYILALNPRHSSNRHVSFLLLLTSASTLFLGAMESAVDPEGLRLPTMVMSIVIPAIQPWILIVSIVLIRPAWLKGRWKHFWKVMYGLTFLPLVLTLIDAAFNGRLWFTGLPPGSSLEGFIRLTQYTNGILAQPLRILMIMVIPILALLVLAYLAFVDQKRSGLLARQLAWLLLIAQVGAVGIQFGLGNIMPGLSILLTSALFSVVYALAAFRQMISERRFQHGSLQLRITLLILVISLPIFVSVGGFLSDQASNVILNNAGEKLQSISQATRTDIDLWLLMNIRALEQLASSPEIRSMDAEQQKPLLERMARLYPYLYLVSTTDLDGINIARSDADTPKDYSQRKWFQNIQKGNPLALETVVGQTRGTPALIISKPIYAERGNLLGVIMFASELSTLAEQITTTRIGVSGYVMVVDSQNYAVIHPDLASARELENLEAYPPVSALRRGQRNIYTFVDEQGEHWRAYLSLSEMNSGWGVIVQQPENELLAPLRQFQFLAWAALAAGGLLLMISTWFSIRQAVQPIAALTATANAISEGDLDRSAPVESDDEIGSLAKAFNSMTDQLRALIANLEQRVDERTAELERRAVQMQTAAQVAREAAAIRDLKSLLNQATQLISERFGFYHAGIFLIDEAGEYAILQAANSPGGQRMLSRGHKLPVGRVGIVGHVASAAKPRIARNVGEDAVYFDNPDLPLTKSEMALPMKARGQVIGVLDVQSTKQDAFTEEDIEILQILADQIALAIENASLLDESQRAFRELEIQYGQYTRQAWNRQKGGKSLAYLYNRLGVEPIPVSPVEKEIALASLSPSGTDELTDPNLREIIAPILIRNQTVGSVILRRDKDQEAWSTEDYHLVVEAVSQISQALENARLLEENQRRAQQEKTIGDVAAKAQRSLDLDTLLKTAVREIGLATTAARVQIRLGSPESAPTPAKNGGSEREAAE